MRTRPLLLLLLAAGGLLAAILFTFWVAPLAESLLPPTPTFPPRLASPPVEDDGAWLARLNDLRQDSDLAPVSEDPTRTALASLHVGYMLANVPAEGLWHGENPGSLSYTEEGDRAARSSNLAWVENGLLAPAEAIAIWEASPDHLQRMLAPALAQVGFALGCDSRNCAAVLYVGP
jgi:uncharacterized protein YkwD